MAYDDIEHRFTLRLDREDNLLFEEKFRKSGLDNRNDFLRMLIRYGCVITVDYSYINDYNMHFSKIGTNINQIAHVVNSKQSIGRPEIKRLQKEMKKLWQLQRSMQLEEPLINL